MILKNTICSLRQSTRCFRWLRLASHSLFSREDESLVPAYSYLYWRIVDEVPQSHSNSLHLCSLRWLSGR